MYSLPKEKVNFNTLKVPKSVDKIFRLILFKNIENENCIRICFYNYRKSTNYHQRLRNTI